MTRHTLSVLVENKAGVLARVAALFSRRAFNIESLAVGPTENPGLSRMTIVVDADTQPLEQITKQLNKLIEIIKIVELETDATVQRELLLVKVRAPLADRTQVLQTAELFRARVVDVNTETVTLEATGTPDKLQALLAVLAPLGIKEMAQSGTVALGRGPRSMSGSGALRPVDQRSA
jgi:acetolactate synthase-1/3 small subunit